MDTAKIFMNGGSQAVRLPKNCRFDCDEVKVVKLENMVILVPCGDSWESMMSGFDMLDETFANAISEKLDSQEKNLRFD